MPLLEIEKLSKIYFRKAEEVKALQDLNFTVDKGEILSIWGPSGSGKSTLLNIIGCLDRPTCGRIILSGTDMAMISDSALPGFRRKNIGFIFQQFNLISHLTAVENVALPLKYAGIPVKERLKHAEEMLALVGLEHRKDFRWNELSGGEAQRVAIARALVNSPGIVLADEPTGELDTQNSEKLISLIKALNKELGTTFLIVTHDQEMAKISGRTLTLRDGKIV
ncbi:MAG: ABC transporter ATP-binding protein [Firmicutes bacterium]|nr:ABC transporter ATP-binding protein [Bacillota bacterium]